MTAPLPRLLHALWWFGHAYRAQRNKQHGIGRERKRWHALMIAGMGAHLILVRGEGWRLPWISPAAWLLWIGERRRRRTGI